MPLDIVLEALVDVFSAGKKRTDTKRAQREGRVLGARKDAQAHGVSVIDATGDVTLKLDHNGPFLDYRSSGRRVDLSEKQLRKYIRRGMRALTYVK